MYILYRLYHMMKERIKAEQTKMVKMKMGSNKETNDSGPSSIIKSPNNTMDEYR